VVDPVVPMMPVLRVDRPQNIPPYVS